MPSRNLQDLLPAPRHIAETWLKRVRARGVDPLVYCTYRSPEEQEAEYARGRTTPGIPCRHRGTVRPIGTCCFHPLGYVVTHAHAWESWHQMRRAWDAVPMLNGRPLWDVDVTKPLPEPWHIMVQEADVLFIEWAGRWPRFKEAYHFQIRSNLTLEEAKEQALAFESGLQSGPT